MKKYITIVAAFIFVAVLQAPAQQKNDTTVGPKNGALVIVGGGKIGAEIWQRFVKLAGGKEKANVVVIPTAGEDSTVPHNSDQTVQALKALGVKHVTVLHTRDPKEANTESFVAPLKKATAVWFEGGRQWRIADAYLNTQAHKEFDAVLARGGVIGGTSAGATIQGSFLVRGDTKGNSVLIGDHTQGLAFIHGGCGAKCADR